MASVPNMRPGVAPAIPAALAAAITDGAEFARTIALVPTELPEAAEIDVDVPEIELPEAEIETAEVPADPAAIVVAIAPLLQAQVAAPAPAPAPAPKAEVVAEVPIVASPAPAPEIKPRGKAPQPKVAAPEAEVAAPDAKALPETEWPLPKSEAKPAAPIEPREKEAIAAAKRTLDLAAQADAAPRPARPAPHSAAAPVVEVRPQVEAPVSAPIINVAPAQIEAAPVRVRETAAPVPERRLDLGNEDEWVDRLARNIAQAAGTDGTIRFRLHPQTLGHLRVELSQGDHGTSIRVTADTEQARAIIADAQPRLAAEARAQGVRIAETHVDLSGSERHASGDPRRQDDARQTPFIRTARAGAEDAQTSDRPAGSRSDRFA